MEPPWSERDALDTMRETSKHENDLINHRLTWLGVINGLVGHLITAKIDANSVVLNLALASAGIAVTLSAWFSLLMAGAALDRQRKAFEERWGVARLDEPGFGIAGIRVRGTDMLTPRTVIPAVILGGWTLVILLKAGGVPDALVYAIPPAVVLAFLGLSRLVQRRLEQPIAAEALTLTAGAATTPERAKLVLVHDAESEELGPDRTG